MKMVTTLLLALSIIVLCVSSWIGAYRTSKLERKVRELETKMKRILRDRP